MQKIMAALAALLVAFRSGARTVGISPKVLAPAIGAAVTAVLALVGLTPAAIGGFLHVSPEVVAAAETAIAAKVAAYLLPPGVVMDQPGEIGTPSDAVNAEAFEAHLS